MKILAIDPGTRCGWAAFAGAELSASGVLNLTPSRWEGGGMRYLKFRQSFVRLLGQFAPDLVVYEEVRRHLGTDAAHVYGGIVGQLTALCEEHSAAYRAVPVGTIKKFATGKGNAPKDLMLEAARARWPNTPVTDDNEADALWLGLLTAKEFE